MTGALWLRVVATVAAALAASWVSLLYRYRRKGRPFASRRSAWRALAVNLRDDGGGHGGGALACRS
jgi:uncharacterized membrane protein